MNSLTAMGLIFVGSIFGAIAQILFKVSTDPVQFMKLGMGFGLYGLAFLIYLYALRSLPLSVAYPIIACSYIFVALGSWLYLHEPWSVSKSIGSVGLVLCIWLIAR